MANELVDNPFEPLTVAIKRFVIVLIFSIAFAYIEGSVVVYLRAIFYPDGFTFPLTNFGEGDLWKRLLLTEVGREGATLVILFSGAWLFAKKRQERIAYFLEIFAVWDIFYYVWLKVLVDWPVSIMDWDILFLMPMAWASPVLAPVLVSAAMLVFSMVILYRNSMGKPLKVSGRDMIGFIAGGVVIVVSFCIGGSHIGDANFAAYFWWPLFGCGYIGIIAVFIKCLIKSG